MKMMMKMKMKMKMSGKFFKTRIKNKYTEIFKPPTSRNPNSHKGFGAFLVFMLLSTNF
jgi:hypothetical protein